MGGPVCWGNTNCQARDYKIALEYAYREQRPVYFIRYGHELPILHIEELCYRNLFRYITQGKYIPLMAMIKMEERMKVLNEESNNCDQKQLASLAGYQMNDENYLINKMQIDAHKKGKTNSGGTSKRRGGENKKDYNIKRNEREDFNKKRIGETEIKQQHPNQRLGTAIAKNSRNTNQGEKTKHLGNFKKGKD